MITLLAFFFVLSLLVLVHELGHYVIAKLGGIGVLRFSIGYPPRLFGIKIGETDYCISAIPFGGYVKLAGQEDFGKADEYDNNPKDFRGKSTPVKIAVLMAGSLMNIATAIVIFFFLFLAQGIPETTNIIGYVEEDSLASEMGITPGDVIIQVQGKQVEGFDEILLPLYMDENVTLTVENEGTERTLQAPRKLEQNEYFGIYPYHEAKVAQVLSDTPAETAGFLKDDVITGIDGNHIHGWYHMSDIVRANPGREMDFTIRRNDSEIILPVVIGETIQDTPDGSKVTIGKIGVGRYDYTRKAGVIECANVAVKNTVFLATHMIEFIGRLVTGRMSSKLLGGPLMIAQMAGESAKSGFADLMRFTAFISINLGILNLMPFPVLDGGHIFILCIESVIRRKVSEKAKLVLQQTGTVFLLLLMLYITFNDLMRFDTIAKLFGGG